jgi:hypothetical protein
MADITHPLYPGVTVNTDNAVKDPDLSLWTYTATIDGKPVRLPGMSVSPEAMVSGHGDDTSEAYVSLASSLSPLVKGTTPAGDRGILEETFFPAVQLSAANLLGIPADVSNTVLGVVDAGINAVRYAAGGFEKFPERKNLVFGSEECFWRKCTNCARP